MKIREFLERMFAGCLLVLLSPVFLVMAVMIVAESSGPAVISQIRVGQGEKLFKMYKFRTMVQDAESLHNSLMMEQIQSGGSFFLKLHPDFRVTRIGQKIRRSGADELPQLWNVMRGEMQLIGPRPVLPAELPWIPSEFRSRFECRPGVTGPSQISGLQSKSPEEALRLDVTYCTSNRSVKRDLQLLLNTVRILILQRVEGSQTGAEQVASSSENHGHPKEKY